MLLSAEMEKDDGYPFCPECRAEGQALVDSLVLDGEILENKNVIGIWPMKEIAEPDAHISYEPMRRILNNSPPKRFFRSFWSSAARRMLQRDRIMNYALIFNQAKTKTEVL